MLGTAGVISHADLSFPWASLLKCLHSGGIAHEVIIIYSTTQEWMDTSIPHEPNSNKTERIHQFPLIPYLQVKWVENEVPKLVTDREESLELHCPWRNLPYFFSCFIINRIQGTLASILHSHMLVLFFWLESLQRPYCLKLLWGLTRGNFPFSQF